jgi:ankyrin repeat protein
MPSEPFEQLRDDIKRGDTIALRRFLDANGDPNLHNLAGESLLSVAAAAGQTQLVEGLLSGGAQVNYHSHGWTPLYLASLNGHEHTVQVLLDNGADPTIPVSGASIASWLSHYGSARSRIVEMLTAKRARGAGNAT